MILAEDITLSNLGDKKTRVRASQMQKCHSGVITRLVCPIEFKVSRVLFFSDCFGFISDSEQRKLPAHWLSFRLVLLYAAEQL